MRAGRLRHRIALQANTPTTNDFGEEVDDWDTYATVWARVSPLQGSERWAAQQVGSEVTHEVEIRWSTDVEDIKSEHQILFDGRTLDIAGPYVPDERRVNILIPCSERVE